MPDKPTPFLYSDIYEAPTSWRKLNHANLSVSQLNWIVSKAYEIGDFCDCEGTQVFKPNWAGARVAFRELNHIVNNVWVTK